MDILDHRSRPAVLGIHFACQRPLSRIPRSARVLELFDDQHSCGHLHPVSMGDKEPCIPLLLLDSRSRSADRVVCRDNIVVDARGARYAPPRSNAAPTGRDCRSFLGGLLSSLLSEGSSAMDLES